MAAAPLHLVRDRSGSASTGLVRHHVGGSGDDATAEDMMEEGWTGRRPRLSTMITSGSAVEGRRLKKRSSSGPSRRSVLAAVLLLVLLVAISVCSVAAATSMGVDHDINCCVRDGHVCVPRKLDDMHRLRRPAASCPAPASRSHGDMTLADDGRGGASSDDDTAANMMEQGWVALRPRPQTLITSSDQAVKQQRRPKKRSSSSGLPRAKKVLVVVTLVLLMVSSALISIYSIVDARFPDMELVTRICSVAISLAAGVGTSHECEYQTS
ncbi:hypothetical protein EJB05_15162, partial [Eragrostis curvula]